jgi:hypothetical protein
MPFRGFLARIRKLLPLDLDIHYASIAKDLQSGALRQPVQPMSDRELAAAIAEFQKTTPSAASSKTLGNAFNPKKGR